MGQSVGEISMDLALNSKDFKSQLQSSVSNAVGSVGSSTGSLISSTFSKLGRIAAAAFSVKAIADFASSSIELGSDLAEVQNVVDVAFGEMSSAADEWASHSIMNYGMSETSAKKMLGTFGSMATSFGYTQKEALGMSEQLTGLAGDVASFYNLSQDEAYTKLKSVFTGETESLKELGVVMTQTALDQYALANGYGKTTSAMTEQEKVALRLAFVTNQLNNASGDFVRTQDSWANQTRILSEQWNAFKAQIGQAFIQVLTPAIKVLNSLMEKLVQIATIINSLTASIFGKQVANASSTVSSAASGASDLASNLDDTASSAAKAVKSLMGFDEINQLSDNSSSSSGSGGSGSGSGYSSDFETTADETDSLSDKIDELYEKLKKIYDTSGWEGVGKAIGDFFADKLNSIDWDTIQTKLNELTISFAQLLNGLNKSDLSAAVGTFIAEFLNTLTYMWKNFWETFDGKELGASLARGFNNFMETYDWEALGEGIKAFVDDFWDMVIETIKDVDWGQVLKAIGDLFTGLGVDGILKLFGFILLRKAIKTGFKSLFAKTAVEGAENGIPTLLTKLSEKLISGPNSLVKILTKGITDGFEAGIGQGLLSIGGILLAVFGTIESIEGLFASIGSIKFGGTLLDASTWTFSEDTIMGSLSNFGTKLTDWYKNLDQNVKDAYDTIGLTSHTKIHDIYNDINQALDENGNLVEENLSGNLDSELKVVNKYIAELEESGQTNNALYEGLVEMRDTLVKGQELSKLETEKFFEEYKEQITEGVSGWTEEFRIQYKQMNSETQTQFNAYLIKYDTLVSGVKTRMNRLITILSQKVSDAQGYINQMNNLMKAADKANTYITATEAYKFALASGAPAKITSKGGTNGTYFSTFATSEQHAQGAYVKANTPRLAVIGDNKYEGEFVAPESKLAEAVSNAMIQTMPAMMSAIQQAGVTGGNSSSGDITIPIYLDGNQLEKVVVSANNKHNIRTGGYR